MTTVTQFGSIWAAEVTKKATKEHHKKQVEAGSDAGKLSDVPPTTAGDQQKRPWEADPAMEAQICPSAPALAAWIYIYI